MFLKHENEEMQIEEVNEIFPFLKEQLLQTYKIEKESTNLTADFNTPGISLDELTKMNKDEIRISRFYNIIKE